MFARLFTFVALLALPASAAADAPPRRPAALAPLPTAHTPRRIEGWTVRVDDRLLAGEGAAIGERAIKLLTARLVTIAVVVAEGPLAKLRGVTIQLDLTHGGSARCSTTPAPAG